MPDSLTALLDQANDRPWLEFLGRRWSARAVVDEAGRAAAGLGALGLAPGERLGLLLPNLPVAVTALVAAWRAGLVAAPMDPRQPPAALGGWQARLRPAALATLDLATVYERARPLFDDAALRFVLVARLAPQLSPLKRLIGPWLRAGGSARPAYDRRILAWDGLAGGGVAPPPGDGAPALMLPDGTTLKRGAVAALAEPSVGARRLLGRPLATAAAIGALLASLAGGGTLVLSPRLDQRSLAKVAKAAATTETVE